MDYNKSKYTVFPDNYSLDRRMANGESLEEIFDGIDYLSKCHTEDEQRPITVRIGRKYNYVAKNYLLFDNWFVLADDFQEYDRYSYAYRRNDAYGIREGGVLIRRDGSYVTREEFVDIKFGNNIGHGSYAIVKQYNGLLNVIEVATGNKLDQIGLKADCIAANENNYDFGIFIVAKGDIKSLHDLDWLVNFKGEEIAMSKRLKMNFCSFKNGLLSPDLWFDYVEPFQIEPIGDSYSFAKFTVVRLNNKYNYISTDGKLLSDIWFDVASVYGYGRFGIAGILRNSSYSQLPDYDDEFEYNPAKYVLYHIDRYGRIKKK